MQICDARVARKFLINLPCFLLRDYVRDHDMTVGDEPEKTHLRDPTERRAAWFNCCKPVFRRLVMNVAVGSQRDPDVDVRQAGFQSRRWSAKAFLAFWI